MLEPTLHGEVAPLHDAPQLVDGRQAELLQDLLGRAPRLLQLGVLVDEDQGVTLHVLQDRRPAGLSQFETFKPRLKPTSKELGLKHTGRTV